MLRIFIKTWSHLCNVYKQLPIHQQSPLNSAPVEQKLGKLSVSPLDIYIEFFGICAFFSQKTPHVKERQSNKDLFCPFQKKIKIKNASQNPRASEQTSPYTQRCKSHSWMEASQHYKCIIRQYEHTAGRGLVCLAFFLCPALNTVPRHNWCSINKLKIITVISILTTPFLRAH